MTKQPEQPAPGGERAWDAVLTSLCHLQRVFPDAVVVGGIASARYAAHVLTDLEAVAGWETARVRRPHLILGSLEGIDTAIRQLRRSRPLETTAVHVRALLSCVWIATRRAIM